MINPLTKTAGAIRFTSPLPKLMTGIATGEPFYVHARTHLAELAAILPLQLSIVDEPGTSLLFPEDGLSISLADISAIHGSAMDHKSKHALALEIAMHGEPRRIAMVAVPEINGMTDFSEAIRSQPSESISKEQYIGWKKRFTCPPKVCPCCEKSARHIRKYAEYHPLTDVFQDAARSGLHLRCQVVSEGLAFSTWLRPCRFRSLNGTLELVSENGGSQLQVDVGLCHMIRITRKQLDAEIFSAIEIHDSHARRHLTILAKGEEVENKWRKMFPPTW